MTGASGCAGSGSRTPSPWIPRRDARSRPFELRSVAQKNNVPLAGDSRIPRPGFAVAMLTLPRLPY
jgi:hypothetical protein